MTTIAIFGGTGYAGGAIASEAASRGHRVIAVARGAADRANAGIEYRAGDIHDAAFVDALASEADVLVVALPHREIDGRKLGDALPSLLDASRAHATRLGFVGGAGSSLVAPGGPRLIDGPDFNDEWKPEAQAAVDLLEALRASDGADWFVMSPPALFGSYAPGERLGRYRLGGDVLVTTDDGQSFISGEDYAIAFVDEIEQAAHRNERVTVGY